MSDRCASCGGWLTPGLDHCPGCHALVATEPGPAGRADLADPLRGGGGDGLELELDLPGPAPVPRSPGVEPEAYGGRDLGGDPLSSGPGNAGSAGLALELDQAPRAPARRHAGPLPDVAAAPEGRRRTSTRPPGASRRGQAMYDAEVRAFADYGSAPEGIFAAIPYALHVVGRRQQLKAGLRDARVARQGAEAAARRALIAVGRALVERAAELDLGEVAREVEAVRQAQTEHGQRVQRTSAVRTQMEEQRAALGEQIQAAQAEANPWRDKETKLTTQLRVREGELSRARAQLKRVDIEIRNVHAGATEGTPVDRARLAALQADKEQKKVEVQRAEGPVSELVRELAGVRHELAARTTKVTQLEELRRQAEQQMRREESAHEAGAGEASQRVEQALHDLGLAAHLRGADTPLGPLASRADAALASFEERQHTEGMHERALGAYDRAGFNKGAAVLGGAALVVLAMLVVAIAL